MGLRLSPWVRISKRGEAVAIPRVVLVYAELEVTETVALFRVKFQVGDGLFRLEELVFTLLAVANLSDPLQNEPVVRGKSALDHVEVVQLVLDDDLALVNHVVLVDDVNVLLVEDLESRALRDDEGVF